MALGPAILLDVALNPRVQDVAGKLFNSVYSRIFKAGPVKPAAPDLIELRALAPAEKLVAERLMAIEGQLARMPTDDEMATAFASLQAEVRLGQKRMWLGIAGFGALDSFLLFALYLR
ncbi:hypothetical protein GCM10007973_29950 [Polymorphobacter multimanifer]|nr:hypothetical protein GCM10007973_29950 [Polymorphobacter multimanifer]